MVKQKGNITGCFITYIDRMGLYPNWFRCWDFMMSRTPRGYEDMYYSHIESFWEDQGRYPSRSEYGSWEERGKWPWVFLWLGVRGKVQFQLSCWWLYGLKFPTGTDGESTWAFLSACPHVAQRVSQGGMGLKSYLWSHVKNDIRYLITQGTRTIPATMYLCILVTGRQTQF